jgi:hypothetical protein
MIIGIHIAKKGQLFLPGNAAAWSRCCELMAGLRRAIQAAVQTHAPLGYENETGFHFGVEALPFLSGWSI